MSERVMRAKMAVGFVQQHRARDWNPETKQYDGTERVTGETLSMHAVAAPKYDASGLDEDNTFARMSPGASLSINIANPALFGKFHVGQRFYVDFTEAPDSPAKAA
jgi:hypothetical protein